MEVWQVDTSTFDLSPYDYILASNVQHISLSSITSPTDWIQPTLDESMTQDVTNPIKYRKNALGQLEIKGQCTGSLVDGTLFTLNAGYRPASTIIKFLQQIGDIPYQYVIVGIAGGPSQGRVMCSNWTPSFNLVRLNDIINL